MPRSRKRRSIHLDNAESRLAEIVGINPNLDFGEGLTTRNIKDKIEKARGALADYNTLISNLEKARVLFSLLENEVKDLHTRMLTGVATRYGKESAEYRMAGGVPPSERRRSRSSAAVVADG